MRKWMAAVVVAAFMGGPAVLFADEKIDFDQGIDAGAFLKKSCEQTQLDEHARPDVLRTPVASQMRAPALLPLRKPSALPDEIAQFPVLPIFPPAIGLAKPICRRIPSDSCAVIPPLPSDILRPHKGGGILLRHNQRNIVCPDTVR